MLDLPSLFDLAATFPDDDANRTAPGKFFPQDRHVLGRIAGFSAHGEAHLGKRNFDLFPAEYSTRVQDPRDVDFHVEKCKPAVLADFVNYNVVAAATTGKKSF